MSVSSWAALVYEWINPAGVASAVLLPCTRAALRRWRGERDGFVHGLVISDVAAGFALPSYAVMILCPMLDGFADHVERSVLQLAGAVALIQVLRDVFGRHR